MLDADGVLVDFTTGALAAFTTITGREVDPNALTEWEFIKALPFETQEQEDRYHAMLCMQGFCKNLAPLPGAMEAIRRLTSLEVDVHIVTTPMKNCPTWAYERELWLAHHLGLPRTRIHHSKNKSIYAGDIFVDDSPENVTEWAEHNPNGAAFLWDTLHNRTSTDLARLLSWEGLFALIETRKSRLAGR